MVTKTDLLIVGGDSDPNTRRVVDQAHLRGVDYQFWNTDEGTARQIAWDFENPEIDLGAQRIAPRALFLRFNVFGGEPSSNHSAFDTVQSFALAWPEIRILNRQTITDANNKSANLRHARDVGFEIPESIVMSDLTPLQTIPSANAKIIKPLGGGAHTLAVDVIREDLQRLAKLPPQFVQEKLEGENLRVFSIGNELFCFQLQTTKLDYREDDAVDVIQIDVPTEIIDSTQKLVARLEFDYCALDFRCRRRLEHPVFLEINSFPMFVRFDDASENSLADAMLKFLLAK